jgi:DNA-directed RNA polymerase subunit F
MVNPTIIEEKPITLVEVKKSVKKIEKRDEDLNYLTGRTKDYADNFAKLSQKSETELIEKINALNLTRLKEEHIVKIVDFLPKTVEELRVVLQAYPLSLPKKDEEAIVKTVKEVL